MKQFKRQITATVGSILIALGLIGINAEQAIAQGKARKGAKVRSGSSAKIISPRDSASGLPTGKRIDTAGTTSSSGGAEPAATQQQTPQRGTLSIIAILIGVVQREVAIYVPTGYKAGAAVPLVFTLHGGGGNASKMYAPDKRIVEYAESQGFIAVFPNGLPSPDAPAGSDKFYWEDPANIGFMNHLIDLMTTRFTIDSRRIYFIGFSGGAKLCYRLVADPAISARLAAIATVAGDIGSKRTDPPTTPWEFIDPIVSGGAPMSALLLQGGADTGLPAMGGFPDDFTSIRSSFQTKVDIWRLFVGAMDGTSNTLQFAPARVQAMRYTNPATGHTVISVLDPALPHKWPEWNFMGAIWDFFEQAPTR